MNARQKNLLTLLAVAAVAGGLGLYAWFGVMKPRAAETSARQGPVALFPSAPTAGPEDGGPAAALVFTSISVTSPEARLVLEPREGVWRLTSPVSALADRGAVAEVLAELRHATFSAPVSETPTDEELERYGLKPPLAQVSEREDSTIGVEDVYSFGATMEIIGDLFVYTNDPAILEGLAA